MASKPPGSAPKNSGSEAAESFDQAARKLLEKAVSLHNGNRPLKCAEIQQPVSRICADARERNTTAERLIIELKRIWYSVPETASHEKAEVISRLVTMCIVEFYSNQSESQRNRP